MIGRSQVVAPAVVRRIGHHVVEGLHRRRLADAPENPLGGVGVLRVVEHLPRLAVGGRRRRRVAAQPANEQLAPVAALLRGVGGLVVVAVEGKHLVAEVLVVAGEGAAAHVVVGARPRAEVPVLFLVAGVGRAEVRVVRDVIVALGRRAVVVVVVLAVAGRRVVVVVVRRRLVRSC